MQFLSNDSSRIPSISIGLQRASGDLLELQQLGDRSHRPCRPPGAARWTRRTWQGGALVRGGLVVWLNDGPAAPSKTIIAFTILLLLPIHSELKCIIWFGNGFWYLGIEIMFIQTWFLPQKRLVICWKIITSHKGHKVQCRKAFWGWLIKFQWRNLREI